MDKTMGDATQRVVVASLADAHRVWTKAAAERQEENPFSAKEFYQIFTPPKRSEVKTITLRPSSLPASITDCHCWSFIVFDRRRKSFINASNVATGITVRCHMVDPNARMPKEFSCQPRIMIRSEADEASEPLLAIEDAPPLTAADNLVLAADADADQDQVTCHIPIETKIYNGWKVSYKKLSPETESVDDICKRQDLNHGCQYVFHWTNRKSTSI